MITVFSISALATATLSFLLGFLVYIKNRRSSLNRLWFLASISLGFWSLGLGLEVISSSEPEALFWNRILYLGAVFIPVLFYHFVVVLLKIQDTKRRYINIGYFLGFFFLFFNFFGRLFVKGVPPQAGFPYWVDAGPLYYPYSATLVIYLLSSIYLLFKAIPREAGSRKSQIKYVLIAYVIGFGGGITNFFPQFIRVYPFGQFFVAFYILFITYAISRYRLMDIRTLVKRSSVFAILVVIIGSVFALLSALVGQFLNIFFQVDLYWVTAGTAAIVITVIFSPLKNFLEKITDKFLFAKTYNASEVLAKINDVTSSITSLESLLSSVGLILSDSFHCSKILIALLDQNRQLKLEQSKGFDSSISRGLLKDYGRALSAYFPKGSEIKVISELKSRHEMGEYRPKSKKLLYKLDELDVALVAPLFVKEKLIGMVILGNKRSDDPYNSEDLELVDIVAGQSAIAIENTRLYEEQKNFSIKLQGEVKRATKNLKLANKELKRLDQSKSEFLSIASHQLRTPLTIIKGYTSMMLEGSFGKVPKKINVNIKKVFIATERLINLVESLLNVSRIEQGRIQFDVEPVDLVKITRVLVEGFILKAKSKKLKLEFVPEKGIPKAMADPQKVQEVISNIIDNSVKYTEKGEIIVGMHVEGQSVVFTCQDTGIGIDSEDLPRLFEKFVRGKGMMQVYTEGTGLGMYFARMVVENMGGRIWAESPGKGMGSKFSFSLPMADKKKAKKVK